MQRDPLRSGCVKSTCKDTQMSPPHTPLSGLSLVRGSVDARLQNLPFCSRKIRNKFILFSLYKDFPGQKAARNVLGRLRREGIKHNTEKFGRIVVVLLRNMV